MSLLKDSFDQCKVCREEYVKGIAHYCQRTDTKILSNRAKVRSLRKLLEWLGDKADEIQVH